jgi:hypothetical protein
MKNWITSIALVAASSWSFADDIRLSEPAYGGSGCPAGTVSASLAPDAKTLSIIFDQYAVELDPSMSGKTRDRKNCQISIPVHIPQGLSVSILELDFRGYNNLPFGASSKLDISYFLGVGSTRSSARFAKTFTGPKDAEYLVNNAIGVEAIVWSPCGKDVNLRTSTSLTLSNPELMDNAMVTLDSIDVSAGLVYSLQWRTCR